MNDLVLLPLGPCDTCVLPCVAGEMLGHFTRRLCVRTSSSLSRSSLSCFPSFSSSHFSTTSSSSHSQPSLHAPLRNNTLTNNNNNNGNTSLSVGTLRLVMGTSTLFFEDDEDDGH